MVVKNPEIVAVPVGAAEPAAQARLSGPGSMGWRPVLFSLFAALLVNVTIVLVVAPEVSKSLTLTYSLSYGDLYNFIAESLDQGNGYRVDPAMGETMIREPGYPLLLAAVYKFTGYGMQQGRVVCVVLALGSALLLLCLARKITGDLMTALGSALIFLLYPGILVAEARPGVEIPSIFTVLLFMLALYSAVEAGSGWRFFAAGLLMGVAVLVRSEVMLFPLFPLIYFVLSSKDARERIKVMFRFAWLVLGALLAMSPWIVRNYELVHRFVPSATVAGVAAQEGLFTCEHSIAGEPFYVAQSRAGFEREEIAQRAGIPFVGPYYQLFYTPQDEIAFNQALLRHVSTEYRSHPQLLVKCGAKNIFFNFWFLGKTPQTVDLNMAMQAPLLLLAIGGMVVLWRRALWKRAAIVLLYLAYIPAIHAPIIAHARHSVLVAPFLALLAAACLVSVWQALRSQNPGALFQPAASATSGN